MLWVRNCPHLWLLPHNSSSLWGNAMKFYDFVNEGLVPVLTEIGVSGWINVRVNKQQSCIKPSVRRGCVHTHTLTVELLHAICCGCGDTHALQRSEICPLRAVCRGCGGTYALWRAGIEFFPVCRHSQWSFRYSHSLAPHPVPAFFGGSVLIEILGHLLFVTNLRLFGFIRVDFFWW